MYFVLHSTYCANCVILYNIKYNRLRIKSFCYFITVLYIIITMLYYRNCLRKF